MKKRRELTLPQLMVISLGLVAFVFFARNFDTTRPYPVIFLILCVILAEFIDVRLPQGEPVSVSSAFVIFALFLFRLPQVMAVAGMGFLVSALIKQKKANVAGILRPVAAVSLEVFAAASVFQWLGGQVGVVNLQGLYLLPLVGVCLTYFGLKIILEQFFVSSSRKLPFLPNLFGAVRLLSPTYLALACTGILMTLMFKLMSFWGVLLFFLPLLVTRHSFKLYMDIKQTYQSTISALAAAIEAQDPRKKGHARRVARHSISIGRELGLRGRQLEMLGYAALLHDTGKLGAEDDDFAVFWEDERMGTEDGRAVHALKGAEILEQVDFLKGISGVVREHHTSYILAKNGNGQKIPLAARIINVASCYDDLTHVQEDGPCSPRQAISKIKAEQGVRFDPRVVRAFASILHRQGKLVILF